MSQAMVMMAGIKRIPPVQRTAPGMSNCMTSKCMDILAHFFG